MIPEDLAHTARVVARDDAAHSQDLTYGVPDGAIDDFAWEAAAKSAVSAEVPHRGIDTRTAAGKRKSTPPSPAAPAAHADRRPDRAARDERRARAALRPNTGLVDSSPIDPPVHP